MIAKQFTERMNFHLYKYAASNLRTLFSPSFRSKAIIKRFKSDLMRAVCINEFGPPDVLKIKEIPKPVPGKTDVLVKVHSAGVNPVDTYIREGVFSNVPKLPLVLGKEAAGVVEEVGEGVTQFEVGDRVTCCLPWNGGYAEYVKCDEKRTINLPDSLSFSQGATLYVAYFSALRALITKCRLQPGDKLLVHGASGAVGIAALQIAKSLGAEIVGTAGTPAGMELVQSMGAHHVLNHRNKGYALEAFAATKAEGFDVILENCSHFNLGIDLKLLRNNGRIAVVGSRGPVEVDPRFIINTEAQIHGIKLFAVTEDDFTEYVEFLQDGIARGTIKPFVAHEYTMAQAPTAHIRIMSNIGARGKLVLKLD